MGLEPMRHLRVDRLAICSVTTPAPLLYFLNELSHKMRMQMYCFKNYLATFLIILCDVILEGLNDPSPSTLRG